MRGKGTMASALQINRFDYSSLDLLYLHLIQVIDEEIWIQEKFSSSFVVGLDKSGAFSQNRINLFVEYAFFTHWFFCFVPKRKLLFVFNKTLRLGKQLIELMR